MTLYDYDLHNHTELSKDGLTPGRTLIDMAAKRGMKGLGICDHDEFPDESLYAYARQKGIKLALGTEFTCELSHVIGFNMHPQGPDRIFMEDRFHHLRQDSIDTAITLINGLHDEGFDITTENVIRFSGKKNIQKLFVLTYMAEVCKTYPPHIKKRFTSWADARVYIADKPYYVPDGASIEELDPLRAIELIHSAGGYAVWAHPFFTPEKLRSQYFKTFCAKGIDAIEASYCYQENGYKGEETNRQIEEKVRLFLQEKGIPASGGSDSHFPVKTYADLSPIRPGDMGIQEDEFAGVSAFFR
ncbi:MAG: PHP domain-containing protein [Fibrobacteria bacterium]|nr:PHP domain-containing protein [Fibrobacteria bacterium]